MAARGTVSAVRPRLRLAGLLLALALGLALPAYAPASFPGGNGKIAFHGAQEDFDGTVLDLQIFSASADGSGLTQMTNDPRWSFDPVWSPDGSKIAFTRCRESAGCDVTRRPGRTVYIEPPCSSPSCPLSDFFPLLDVWVMNADGTGLQMVASQAADPAWSPDGQKIAYAGWDDDIYWRNLTAPGGGSVTSDHAYQFQGCSGDFCVINDSPAWSPSGQRIAYVHARAGPDGEGGWGVTDEHVWSANPDGTAAADLTGSMPSFRENGPNWSPSGARLALYIDGYVHSMNPDGSGVTRISPPGVNGSAPAWAPQAGARIAFIDNEIYTMNANGTDVAQVANIFDRYEGAPDWQPLRRYPRPAGATPLSAAMVPAFAACTTPNSTHVAPLDRPSCAPPTAESPVLTTSTLGQGSAQARLDTVVGNAATIADEADINMTAFATDVRCASAAAAGCSAAGEDYSGSVLLSTTIRITDQASELGGGAAPATVQDARLEAPMGCTPTPDPAIGSSCAVTTSADSLLPGMAREGKRTVMSAFRLEIKDAGPNGTGYGTGCPPTCGDGDEAVYLVQGVFAP